MADWRNRLEQIINKFKFQLNAKGIDSIDQLRDVFMSFDKNMDKVLDKLEFEAMLAGLGVFLSTQELRTLTNHFDHNKDGMISYDEFVQAMRTDMSDARLAVVKRAWSEVTGGADSFPTADLKAAYRADQHPRVLSREKKADDVFAAFCGGIDSCTQGADSITQEQFCIYYSLLNVVLPAERETYFTQIVVNTWGLNADKSRVHSTRLQQIRDTIFEKIRQRTHGADDEGKTCKRIFKHFDLNGNGTIEFKEFCQGLETIGCTFSSVEIQALFDSLDTNGSGRVDYEEMAAMVAIRGSGNNPNVNPVFGLNRDPPKQILDKILSSLQSSGNDQSVRLLSQLFIKMDKNGNGVLDRHEIQWVLRQIGLKLNVAEFERIFKYFDKNGDGVVSYHEFVTSVRGELTGEKLGLVHALASKLADQDGKIKIEDMVAACHFEHDPSVSSGKKTITEQQNFMREGFTLQNHDGKITVEDLVDYFNDLNGQITSVDPDAFKKGMKLFWDIEL